MKNKKQTTQRIKEVLGASLTIEEVENKLAILEAKSREQAPYFDGRLLDKISLLRTALDDRMDILNPSVSQMNRVFDRIESLLERGGK
jgi:hypothetical protein